MGIKLEDLKADSTKIVSDKQGLNYIEIQQIIKSLYLCSILEGADLVFENLFHVVS
jgi:hypothetical protein